MGERNKKTKAVLYSAALSIAFMAFPVASGVIVAVNHVTIPANYMVQGAFIWVSIAIPAIIMIRAKIGPGEIGFTGLNKGSAGKALYFIPPIAMKVGFLFFRASCTMPTIAALVFFTAAIGLAEEFYFRGIILRRLLTCFSVKQAVILSSTLFAAVHASQAFSGTDIVMVVLTIFNALFFGVVASELVIITGSLIPVILWHAFYDFVNWVTCAQGTAKITLIVIQSVVTIIYGLYLWLKLPAEKSAQASRR